MVYNKLYKILVPYAPYMQTGWIFSVKGTDGRNHGLSSSVAIIVLAGVVIGTFFKGFFAELGKISAQKLFEAIESKIKKEDYSSINIKIKELNTLIESYNNEINQLDNKEIEKAIGIGKNNVLKEIEEAGIPKNRADKITSLCIEIIRKEHLCKNKNFENK